MFKYRFRKTQKKSHKWVPILPVDRMYWRGCGPRQTSASIIITNGFYYTSHDGAQHSQHPGKSDDWQTPLACNKILTINAHTSPMHRKICKKKKTFFLGQQLCPTSELNRESGWIGMSLKSLTGVRDSEPGSWIHDVSTCVGASFVPVMFRITWQ